MAVQLDETEMTHAGEQPNTLLRTFKEEDHARSFVGGAIRLGLLEGYRRAEDARKDETEGTVRHHWKLQSPVCCERSSMNPYFILCTSHPEADRRALTERFGPYIVRMNDPMELLNRLELAWRKHSLASGRCIITPVVYNKDTLLDPTPGLLPPPAYSYSQKPKSFEVEREFRYVLTCTADAVKLRTFAIGEDRAAPAPDRLTPRLPDHVTLELPDCSDICSLARPGQMQVVTEWFDGLPAASRRG